VGIGLGEQGPGLLLEGRDGVGAGGPAQWGVRLRVAVALIRLCQRSTDSVATALCQALLARNQWPSTPLPRCIALTLRR
jgi:hypothetical protein